MSKYHSKYFYSKFISCILDRLKALLTLIVLSSCLLHLPAFSQPSSVNLVAAKAAVQGQLAAFAKDDAELAFSFAAPSIQAVFKTPQNFMVMVIRSYPVVHRPVKVIYLSPSQQAQICFYLFR